MKIRKKIIFITVPIMLLTIIFINIAFGIFFHNFILSQEDSGVMLIRDNIASYLLDLQKKYNGSLNDWGHWDDTYDFISNKNPEYIDENLIPATFINLDVNFILFIDDTDSILYKQFFDFDRQELSEYPIDFFKNFDTIIRFSELEEDTFGIFQLANEFYFVATTTITDSEIVKQPNGKMIAGRLIDRNIIADIETKIGCEFSTISTFVGKGDVLQPKSEPSTTLRNTAREDKDTLRIELLIQNPHDSTSTLLLTLKKYRDLYRSGMNNIYWFASINTLALGFMSFIIFILLGKYLSKPFEKILEDVKNIDLTKKEYIKISEKEDDEFSFLRKSVNNMLTRIELEQSNVREHEEKLYATLLSVGDGVITIGVDNRIQFMNPVAQQLTGWKLEDALGEPIETVFRIVNEFTRAQVENPVKLVFETEKIVQLANHTILLSKDGTEKAIEDTVAPIKDKSGKVIGCVLIFRDFTEKKEKEKKIEYLSYHDQLTGVYNRRFFEEELKRLDSKRNIPLSFIYADVNGLKLINDAFGHDTGDQLIRWVADALTDECRSGDIIARIGGDEFVILLPKTHSASVEKLVEQMKEKIEQKEIMGINLSISFGWDTKNREDESAWDVLKNAEGSMYQTKILNSYSKRNAVIKSIVNALLIKSPWEEAHSQRVSTICETIGKAYQLNEDDIEDLRTAGELHDIGKIAVDDTLLNKAGKLNEAEWAQIKQHPEIGYRLLSTSNEFYNISEYVLAHHERWDGKGYPRGLKGEDIQWKARVIAIADAYDAMTYGRPYKGAISQEEAIAVIKENAGAQFDPDIARVFVEKVLGGTW